MNSLTISSVAFINSLPFSFGLERAGLLNNYQLLLDSPAKSIQKFLDKKIDIGLVPVAAINGIEGYKIIGDYCIGANGPVNSVMLFSDVNLSAIKDITLDYQSKTSNLLLQYLVEHYWKINSKFNIGEEGSEQIISGTSAGLAIGDRALQLNGKFKYSFDLAEAWKNCTKFPFVFACWMARKDLDDDVVNKFNQSLEWGMNHLGELIDSLANRSDIGLDRADLEKYFTHHISYEFDENKKAGLELFMDYVSNFQPRTIGA